MDSRLATTIAAVCGVATGFLAATLSTEPYEGFLRGHDATTPLKALTTALAAAALLWGAWRVHERGSSHLGLWLLVAGATTPVWFTFYEADHAEAYVATAVAASLAWASLALRLPTSHRAAMVLVHAMAAIQFDAAFEGYFSFLFLWNSVVALIATAAFVAATVAAARHGGVRRAGPIAAVLLGIAVVPLAVLDIQDQGFRTDYLVVVVGFVATIAVASLARQALRRETAKLAP